MTGRKGPRALELYCGIGGFAAALDRDVDIVSGVDINRRALEVYADNFPHPTVVATLESIPVERLRAWSADLWWLSPPCQPFTRRGSGRDHQDPRSRSLLGLIELLHEVLPPYVALENVPEFAGSETCSRLVRTLEHLDYEVQSRVLCPTELGVPNRRRRFYLVAGRRPLLPFASLRQPMRPLANFLDPVAPAALSVPRAMVARYMHALDIVDAADPTAVTACFTSAYGRSPVRSGSYLRTASGLRRFSPTEILRLLGFDDGFRLPAEMPLRTAWHLVGNSLSIPAVRQVLACVPTLAKFTDKRPVRALPSGA